MPRTMTKKAINNRNGMIIVSRDKDEPKFFYLLKKPSSQEPKRLLMSKEVIPKVGVVEAL